MAPAPVAVLGKLALQLGSDAHLSYKGPWPTTGTDGILP